MEQLILGYFIMVNPVKMRTDVSTNCVPALRLLWTRVRLRHL